MAKRPTLVQRIALDGGEDIKRELEALGKAGEKAFAQLKAAAGQVQEVKLEKAIADATFRLKTDVVEVARGVGELGSSLLRFVRNVGLLGGALTGAAVGFVAFVKGGTEAAEAMGAAAQAAGLSVESFGRLSFAAEQSEVPIDQFRAGMARFNRELAAAAQGNDKSAEKFTRLGVRIRDANGQLRPTEEILSDLVDRFSRLPDGAEKSALAMDLFGRSGANLIPFLNLTREGLIELGKQFDEFGLGFTESQVKIADTFNDTLALLRRAVGGIRNQIALLFAPGLTRGAEALLDVIRQNRDEILAFASDLVGRVTPIVEDFVVALSGRREDVRNPWVLEWIDAVSGFGTSVQTAFRSVIIPAFNLFRAALDGVAGALRGLTGINLDAASLAIVIAVGAMTGAFRVLGAAINVARLALIALMRHPIVAGITLIAGAFVTLATRESEAERAAREHEEALNDLDDALDRVRAGIPGAVADFNKLKLSKLDAAEAAYEHAKAVRDEIKAEKERILANIVPGASPEDRARLEAAFADLEEIKRADAEVDERLARLQRLRATGDAEVGAIMRTARDRAFEVRDAADLAGAALKELADQAAALQVTVTRGGAGGLSRQTFGVTPVTDPDTGITAQVVTAQGEVEQLGAKVDEVKAKTEAAGEAFDDLSESARSVPQAFSEAPSAAANLAAGVQDAQAQLTGLAEAVRSAFGDVAASIGSSFATLASTVSQLITQLKSELEALRSAIAAARAEASSSGGGSPSRFSGGGSVRGPGTSTSDSILALLSNGEFVLSARAVRHWGVDFLRSLNALRLPRGFSAGGLIDGIRGSLGGIAVPRLAAGGLVPRTAAAAGGGRPFVLNIDGFGSFGPMLAPQNVLDEMMRAARLKGIASAGKAPSGVR